MTRWIGKRGLWGVAVGTAIAAGSVTAGPEVGDTVVFKEGNKDRKVTVTKVNKRADKSFEVTGKDAATGESMTWIEGGTGDAPPAPPAGKAAAPVAKTGTPAATKTAPPVAARDAGLPKAKARAEDPIGSTATPMPETPPEKERRLFNGKLFGRDNTPTPPPAASPAAPPIAEAGEPKKIGLLGRLFGKKAPPTPVPAAMPGPAVTTPTQSAPAGKAGPTAAGEPRFAPPARPATSTPVTSTPVAPAPVRSTPVAAPAPTTSVPVPMPLPATRPAAPVSAPAAPTSVPVPTPLPSIPLPAIPTAPAGAQSIRSGDTLHVVLPVGYVPPGMAAADDVHPFAHALKDGSSPTERLIGAKGLAEGRHCSTDRVKAMLFAAAQDDSSSTVRAACLEYLAKLGYYHPDYLAHLYRLSEGQAGEERDAARAALTRLTPRKW